MPKISVILPIYNVAAYLPKCLDSLLNQTLSDIEIICVDDSSADNSLSILQDYAAKDTRIVVLTQPNSGPGVARNKGIMIAKGEYICFADADDWFETNAFEKLYNVAVEYNADLVECGLTTHDEKNGKTKVRINLYSEKEIDVVNNKEIASYLFSGVSAAWNKMCRTELLKKHNIFFSEGRCAEDTIFTVGVRLFAKKIVSLNLPLYNYLQRSTSLTHKKSKSNLEVPVFLGDVVKLLQREGRFDEVSTQFC